MREMKDIPTEIVTCDVCGIDEKEADVDIEVIPLLIGMGYQPSGDDPLAQRFKKLYKTYDVCDRCHARMDHNFLGLSTEEKEQIVYSRLMANDNRMDIRTDPRVQEHDPLHGLPDLFHPMDAIQDESPEDGDILKAAKERFFKNVTEDRTW